MTLTFQQALTRYTNALIVAVSQGGRTMPTSETDKRADDARQQVVRAHKAELQAAAKASEAKTLIKSLRAQNRELEARVRRAAKALGK